LLGKAPRTAEALHAERDETRQPAQQVGHGEQNREG
jgi:hypothetical protein